MFRKWVELLKEESLMVEIFDDYHRMLEHAQWIFTQTCQVILEHGDLRVLETEVALRIEQLEKAELEIRRRIATHLAMSEGHEVGASLVIFRNAHDVLRLGELCRDLEDIMSLGGAVTFCEPYATRIRAIFSELAAQMAVLIVSVTRSDLSSVEKIIVVLNAAGQECDQLIESLIKDVAGNVTSAVETAMTLRLCHRIARYLANIAKGVAADPQQLD
jgi:uncharacterized membrane protein